MAQFVRLDENHIVNLEAISCIEHHGNNGIKIHFIGRWDNVLSLRDSEAAEVLKKLGVS